MEEWREGLNQCSMEFEVTTSNWKNISGCPNLACYTPIENERYKVAGRWDPRLIKSTSTFTEWLHSWGLNTIFESKWILEHSIIIPLGLAYLSLEDEKEKKETIDLICKIPEYVREAIGFNKDLIIY